MYARRLKSRSENLSSMLWKYCRHFRCSQTGISQPHRDHQIKERVIRKFNSFPLSLPCSGSLGFFRRQQSCFLYNSCRCYSSEGKGSNTSEGKHIPVQDAINFDKGKSGKEGVIADLENSNNHAWLGEQDQQEWINNERLSIDSRPKESPFLTKRDRFKNELLRRMVPWEKISVSLKAFPYYIDEHTKHLLVECTTSNLKNQKLATSYGSRLRSSSGRILLQSNPGMELYRERLVRGLAHDLQVNLLVLDSSVLAPYDFGQGCASESEAEDDNGESGEECTSESETEGENDESNEETCESDNENVDVCASAETLKKIVPCSIEEIAKRVSAELEDVAVQAQPDGVGSVEEHKRPLRKGDQVKYVGESVLIESDKRILLGKIPTPDGSTNAYTLISGRWVVQDIVHDFDTQAEDWYIALETLFEVLPSLQPVLTYIPDSTEWLSRAVPKSHRKEFIHKVEELFDQLQGPVVLICGHSIIETGTKEKEKFTVVLPHLGRLPLDIVHDFDTQAEDWYIALETLFEVLPSLQPVLIYIPDSTEWLSRAVPKSHLKEFIHKVEELFDQLQGPVVLICGQSIIETGTKEKEKFTVVLPHLGRLPLPLSLKRLTEGLRAATNSSKDGDISKLFPNTMFINPPNEENLLRTFHKQIEDDRRIILARNNLIELHKVLEEHELSCVELLLVKTDAIFLTKEKAEKVVGWAKNHYLSSSILPSVKGKRLMIPRECLDIALSRLSKDETVSTKTSVNLKSLAKDEYESNFISAVVPPEEVGVKFDDIGALENVKRTLNELVTLPMRRPELFSHGNLLRPCKGILLFGPPGTGKTLLAKALATEAGANFISITGSTLTSKWFGDAEKLTKALFSFASRLAPVIIFVDEVDSLLGARGGSFEHEATRRMRNEFMAAWDGLRSKDSQRILILGATNRPFDLDDAVIRRLPRRIYVDLPDAENRKKILRILLSQENLEQGFRYDELANATEGYSGSDLKNLCVAAAYRPVQELIEEEKGACSATPPLRPLSLEDFLQAKAKVGASVAYDAASMNELRKWNEMYGEGGSRKKTPFGFGD